MTDTIVAGLISAATGLVGALIGGGLTVWGAIKVVRITSHDLELAEIRRQKVLCITALVGFRWVIAEGQASSEWKAKFISELNKVPTLWSDDPEALKNVRDFLAERTNERFIVLLRSLGKSTSLAINNLGDADLRNVFLLS
jgi:hypothetical protein